MSYEDLMREAADPATAPERLRDILEKNKVLNRNRALAGLVWKNPSVPEELWRKAFLLGVPEAWDNPMAPFYVLTWTPRPEDHGDLPKDGARRAVAALFLKSDQCSVEGKLLIRAHLDADTVKTFSDIL